MSSQSAAHSKSLVELADVLRELRAAMLDLEKRHASLLAGVVPEHRASARNLLHYIAMREQDLRALQTRLADIGLSSIGRSEAHALSSVSSVLDVIDRLLCEPGSAASGDIPCDLASGSNLLETHSVKLLGPARHDRGVRIMVTMPAEAAQDYTIVHRLLKNGMDCMRINCAHDEAEAWLKMIEHLRRARVALDRPCSILMDLCGPKLRTGDIEPGPAVRKLRPSRDTYGRVTAPARAWLTDNRAPRLPPLSANGILHVDRDWLAAIRAGDKLRLRDTRGRRRVLRIVDRERGGVWAELTRTAYVTNGSTLERTGARKEHVPAASEITGIEPSEGSIRLRVGDVLVLTRDSVLGRTASYDSAGRLLSPGRVPCTLPEVFGDVKAGERVCLDDGHVVETAEAVSDVEVRVRVERTPRHGALLRAEQGSTYQRGVASARRHPEANGCTPVEEACDAQGAQGRGRFRRRARGGNHQRLLSKLSIAAPAGAPVCPSNHLTGGGDAGSPRRARSLWTMPMWGIYDPMWR